MANLNAEKSENTGQVRCVKCDKLLANRVVREHFEIKCPRCGTLNRIFEQMIEQMIVTDPEGKIIYINSAVEQASGYSIHEAIGKRPSDLWGGQMPKDFYKEMRNKMDKGESVKVFVTNKRKTGELYDVELIVSPILDTDRKVMYLVGIEIVIK